MNSPSEWKGIELTVGITPISIEIIFYWFGSFQVFFLVFFLTIFNSTSGFGKKLKIIAFHAFFFCLLSRVIYGQIHNILCIWQTLCGRGVPISFSIEFLLHTRIRNFFFIFSTQHFHFTESNTISFLFSILFLCAQQLFEMRLMTHCRRKLMRRGFFFK